MSLDVHGLDCGLRKSAGALSAFHDALLPGTIQNALRTAFFREHWDGCDVRFIDRVGLAQLPTVDKEDIRSAGKAAQNRAGVVCNDVFTTGTTGNPLVTVRSDREQKFIKGFFSRRSGGRWESDGRRLRGLEFSNPYHGHLIEVPAPIHMHRVSVYDAGSFDYGRRILIESHDDANVDARCSMLVGLERCLRAFTLDTAARYPDGFPSTSLLAIVTYSQYLTDAWRRRFEDTWGAPVIDRFGVSEVFGGASQCLGCGWWHFDPFVIPEVVGAHSGDTVTEGVGLLALTALFPFQQAQPLVRYLTGDLVEVTHESSCRPGSTSIKPLGRAQFGVPEPDGDAWLVTPASVLEVVEEIPEVSRIPRFADVDQVTDPCAVGHPKYRTQWVRRASGVQVEIQLEISRGVPESRRADIAAHVGEEVAKRNPRLRIALRRGVAAVTVAMCDEVAPDLIAQAHSGGVWSPA